jgi:hypothetical protein
MAIMRSALKPGRADVFGMGASFISSRETRLNQIQQNLVPDRFRMASGLPSIVSARAPQVQTGLATFLRFSCDFPAKFR